MDIADTSTLKEQKRRVILRQAYEYGVVTRLQLGRILPISLPTIAKNLAELLDDGFIVKEGFLDSTGGRRAQAYRFNARSRVAVGVVPRANHLSFAAYDLYGNVIDRGEVVLPYSDTDDYYDNAAQTITGFIDGLGLSSGVVLGVGFSVQGLVSEDGSRITFGEILGNTGLSLKQFSDRIDYPCMFIHDAHASALAELWHDHTIEDAVCIYLNEHVGGAIILNGRIRLGAGRDGICEHITVENGGLMCYCGQRGCLDAYCCESALLDSRTPAGGQLADSAVEARHDQLDVAEFFDRCDDGDASARQRFDELLTHLARGIRNLRTVLGTDIILGGDISKHMGDGDLEQLTEEVRAINPVSDDQFMIRKGICMTGQSMQGAALHYIQMFLDEYTGKLDSSNTSKTCSSPRS